MRSATPSAVIVLVQGVRITPFDRPWSTTTITESKSEQRGRSVMRSTEIWSKGRVQEEGIGDKAGADGCVLVFIC